MFFRGKKERTPYSFGMTWEWVNDAIIFIFRWTIPLSQTSLGGHENSPVVSWTGGSGRFRIVLETQRHGGCVSTLVGVGSTAAPFCKHGGQCVTGTFLRLYEASVSHAHTHTHPLHTQRPISFDFTSCQGLTWWQVALKSNFRVAIVCSSFWKALVYSRQ